MPGVDPAARNSTGTTTPSPMPISVKPIRAVTVERPPSVRSSADAAKSPPPRASVTAPSRRWRRSPKRRLVAMASEKPVYASAAIPAPAPRSER